MKHKDFIADSAFLHEVLDQPKALAITVERLSISPDLLSIAERIVGGEFQRIVLTGMGSSLYALYPLHIELTQHGYESVIVETSELIHYFAGLMNPSSVIIAVSQSGESAEIVRMLKENKGGATIIGVTNTPDSSLASHGNGSLLTHAGDESSVSCKTYVTALAALSILGSLLCKREIEEQRSELRQSARAAAAYLDRWEEHIAELEERCDNVRQWILVGRGPSIATTGTGALTIKEAIRVSAEGMSSATFRHGPIEMLGPETFVLIFSGDANARDLNESLHANITDLGHRSRMIGGGCEGAFGIPEAQDSVRTVLEIMPIQMLILALAARNGIEPGRFAIAAKTTTRE